MINNMDEYIYDFILMKNIYKGTTIYLSTREFLYFRLSPAIFPSAQTALSKGCMK